MSFAAGDVKKDTYLSLLDDFYLLREHLNLLDRTLSPIYSAIKASSDPVSDGLCDRWEYFIGSGFAAIQKYMTSTLILREIARDTAIKSGPKITDSLTLMEAINAGANYWKHLEEWGLNAIVERDVSALKGQAFNTIMTIEKATPWDDYTCSNLLAVLLAGGEFTLSSLLPKVAEWRQSLCAIAT